MSHFIRSFDSFRRNLKRPRENKSNWKTENEKQNNETDGPVRDFEKGKDLGGDLDEEPGGDRVGNGDFVSVPSLQFDEEVLRVSKSDLRRCRER